jgi:anthranilate phosphoribosyltransferase
MFVEILKQLLEGESLTEELARQLMRGWLAGEIPPALSGAILAAIQAKGVAATELAGMAATILPNEGIVRRETIDTCGTGGDGASTFNISTAVAFVAAAAGVKVTKHGSRSVSSRVGSADVLEALGVNLGVDRDTAIAAVDRVGITFLFAPGWHPAMKAVAPIRQELKIRTIFNLIGPLINPLFPNAQVIGTYKADLLIPMAQALKLLGLPRAIVLHGRERLDEAGLGAPTDLAILDGGKIISQAIDPQELGLVSATLADLAGGDVAENVAILKAVLQGKGTPPQRDVVALNTSLALQVSGKIPMGDFASGIELARQTIDSGLPWEKLRELVDFLDRG